mgnify:CR=1 FL=1|jgi:hypothetical protein
MSEQTVEHESPFVGLAEEIVMHRKDFQGVIIGRHSGGKSIVMMTSVANLEETREMLYMALRALEHAEEEAAGAVKH